jgi:hypothetical protein
MITLLLGFVINTVLYGVFLWLAAMVTKVNTTLPAMLAASAIAAAVGLIPVVGWIASLVVLFVLIKKWSDAEVWPDAVLMVVVAWALGALATCGIMSQMAK